MPAMIRTVLADVDPRSAGITNSHDHLFLTTTALPGEELDSLPDAHAELTALHAAGGRTLVQWTPAGLGRRLDDLRDLSRRTGVHVVAATGRHRRAIYGRSAPIALAGAEELSRLFVDDIRARRCGLIKIGTGPGVLDAYEHDSLVAAGHAASETGAPVALHLEHGAGAERVVGVLESLGVRRDQIVLGHLGRHPDLYALLDAAALGAWVCLDAPSPAYRTTVEGLRQRIELLADRGYASRLLLGSDTTTSTARAHGRTGSAMLAEADCPLDPALRDLALRDNPAAAWSF